MGRDSGQQQVPLAQGLPYELELEQLQVPQPAVNELARPARGARRQVPCLDQPDRQAARHRVERDAHAGDPAPNDENVELLALQSGDRVQAGTRTQRSFPHGSPRM